MVDRPNSQGGASGSRYRHRVEFSDDAKLDTSHIADERGQTSGGKNKKKKSGHGTRNLLVYFAAGGGLVGILAIVAVSCVNNAVTSVLNGVVVGSGSSESVNLEKECKTGADANERDDCQVVATVNSVQAYWDEALAGSRPPYRPATTTFFSDTTTTGCGRASAATGPFYCPPDEGVYIDLGFYDSLRNDFGAKGGDFAESYVIAHEYGHHVQNILGFDDRVGRDRKGPESGSVRLELQADCFAGAWAGHAEETGFIEKVTVADLLDGMNAASVIGDDRIQETTRGRVNPEQFTHGTSAQRQKWLLTGYRTKDPAACDTWSGDI
jgi:predicted metalloprotease